MRFLGIIKAVSIKVSQDINIVTEIKMEVDGDPKQLKDLMKKALVVELESQQMTFGKGEPPRKK